LLTLPAAAAQLGVSPRTLEREIAAGRLAVVRIRRARRVEQAEIERYIAAGRQACRSGSAETVGRCASPLAVADALSALSRQALPELMRARSKRGSTGSGSPLRLVPATSSTTPSTAGSRTRQG
jgi:excisionase family DNA binding protein